MKKLRLLLTLVVAGALVAVSPAAAQAPDKKAEARGQIRMTVHTHSDGTLLFPTDRLSFNFTEGERFAYSSRPCSGNAPFNDVGLDFRPDYPGVDDDDGTAPVRHHVTGTITQVRGNRGTLEGTIRTVLCERQNGTQVETGHVIVTHFQARYQRVSDNEVQITGRFRISPTESTGTFKDMTGQGSIQGIFTCLEHQRDPSKPTCAQLGEFHDFVGARGDTTKPPGELVPGLIGNFRDRTIRPV